MKRVLTDELNKTLKELKPDQMSTYIKDNTNQMTGKKSFYYYMKDVLDEKRIKLKDVYSFAGVTESYGGQILRMEKHTTNRDLIIRLCIAGHFSWHETDRALKLYGFNELYAKDPRDACIIVALNNRIFCIPDIDDMLANQGLNILSKDD